MCPDDGAVHLSETLLLHANCCIKKKRVVEKNPHTCGSTTLCSTQLQTIVMLKVRLLSLRRHKHAVAL
jgi:hypothetical protein